MNFIEEFAKHLEFLGLGTVSTAASEGDIFWGLMPDSPDECVCVFSSDSGYCGSDSGARMQVMVRARTTKAAYEKSQAITEALAEYDGYLGGDGARVYIDVINSSQGIGADGKLREIYTSNYLVHYCDF